MTRVAGINNMRYDIRINERLDMYWAEWFDPLALRHTSEGQTSLYGTLPDQAALVGVLNRIAHLGLTLVSVNSTIEEGEGEVQPAHSANRETERR